MKISNHLFYFNLHQKYQTSAKALHWSSKETQEKRFEILLSFIIDDLSNSNLVDIGCAYGHLLNYINEQNIEVRKYYGIDCEEFMINFCKRNYQDNKFMKLDILKEIILKEDYLVCSKAMNLLNKEETFRFITKCFEASKKGFTFNFITNGFYKISKLDILEFCEKLNCEIFITENFINNDVSIFLKKEIS